MQQDQSIQNEHEHNCDVDPADCDCVVCKHLLELNAALEIKQEFEAEHSKNIFQ